MSFFTEHSPPNPYVPSLSSIPIIAAARLRNFEVGEDRGGDLAYAQGANKLDPNTTVLHADRKANPGRVTPLHDDSGQGEAGESGTLQG